jgi:molecular chaperone GrpE
MNQEKKSVLKKNNKNKHKEEKKKKSDKSVDHIDYKEKYLRALADYQNLLKRSAEEKQEFSKYANEQLLIDLIPVYDNLKISLAHISAAADEDAWAQGIKYVIKQFKDFLESQGVEEIETKDKEFDPMTMEAIKGEGDKVAKELKPGYKLKGKVVIAAKVELKK